MRTPVKLLFSIVLSLLGTTSAIAQDVRYNFDWDTHFEKFKTYKWVEIKDSQKADEMKDTEIKAALDAKLRKKGLTKTDADTADLYIAYQIGLGPQAKFESYNTGWGYGPGWYPEGWYVGHHGAVKGPISTIYGSQLAVDMYDSRNHYLVWRGVVDKVFDTAAKPDEQDKKLKKSVGKLLKHYPPPHQYPEVVVPM